MQSSENRHITISSKVQNHLSLVLTERHKAPKLGIHRVFPNLTNKFRGVTVGMNRMENYRKNIGSSVSSSSILTSVQGMLEIIYCDSWRLSARTLQWCNVSCFPTARPHELAAGNTGHCTRTCGLCMTVHQQVFRLWYATILMRYIPGGGLDAVDMLFVLYAP